MSLKSIIKVANYYQNKYGFDVGKFEKKTINPAYQVIINRLLSEYELGGGHQLKIDGVWGPQTQAALDAIQEKLNQVHYKKGKKLKPFVTDEDLDQLNSWSEWVNNKLS